MRLVQEEGKQRQQKRKRDREGEGEGNQTKNPINLELLLARTVQKNCDAH